MLDVCLVFTDDLVGNFLAGSFVEQLHRRPEYDFTLGVDCRDIDNLQVGQFGFEILDASFNKTLLVFRSMVLGVFLKITVRPCLGDCLNHCGPVDTLQAFELCSQ